MAMRPIAGPVLAAAVLATGGAAPAAPGGDSAWRVSATIAGQTSLETSFVTCNATGERARFSQRVRLEATLRPAFTSRFSRATGMAPRFRVSVRGRWTRQGVHRRRELLPGGEERCDTEVPVDCAGPVVVPDRDLARLQLYTRGAYAVGSFVRFPGLAESGVSAPANAGGPYCSDSYYDPTARAVPFFILGGTDIESRAAMTSASPVPVRIPVARLLGRRAFTVAMPRARPNGCEREFLASCRETGSLQMILRFQPA